jgi:pimeloyl-ACP methyl ester carboxylesterase
MPAHLGPWFVCDAQRFLSLYTPDSAEEIFTYAQPGKIPRTLQKSRIPTLVMLAGKDEHTKRPANDLAQWFDQNIRAPHRTVVVPGVGHSFSSKGGSVSGSKGGEGIVARAIRDFMKELEQ